MADITFRSDMTVNLIDHMGSDERICQAARVSTQGADSYGTGEAEGLINFLMREHHGSPFEHVVFQWLISAPIFVWREFMRHRMACLTGDTVITCESGRNDDGTVRTVYKRTIKELYEAWRWSEVKPNNEIIGWRGGKNQGWQPYRSESRGLRVLNEDTGLYETGWVRDIWQAGEKEVFLVTTVDGKSVRASADHPFLTREGWVKVSELRAGMELVTSKNVTLFSGKQIPPALRRGIGVWTSMQRSSIIGEGARCYVCNEWFAATDLEVDHIIPVAEDLSRALNSTNLAPICKSDHRQKTNGEQSLANRSQRLGIKYVRLAEDPKSSGMEMTYDIEMSGPWANYVANGLVVHNSYNEESSRYKQLEPVFYVPSAVRNLVQVGKTGNYTFEPGTDEQYDEVCFTIKDSAMAAYEEYQRLLNLGIAKEVARMVLPVNIYSSAYVTMNFRGLMNFLSLRTKREYATFKSHPQREIEMVAEQMEESVKPITPLAYAAFCKNGRVQP